MNRLEEREKLLVFLDTIRRPHMPLNTIGDRDPLVASGLIDSLAVLEIVLYLETQHGIDFSGGSFDPSELGSIDEILDLVERKKT